MSASEDGVLFEAPEPPRLTLPQSVKLFIAKAAYSSYNVKGRVLCDLCLLACVELGQDWIKAPAPRAARFKRVCDGVTHVICDGHKQLCAENDLA